MLTVPAQRRISAKSGARMSLTLYMSADLVYIKVLGDSRCMGATSLGTERREGRVQTPVCYTSAPSPRRVRLGPPGRWGTACLPAWLVNHDLMGKGIAWLRPANMS